MAGDLRVQRRLVRRLRAHGCTVTIAGNGHLRIALPDGGSVQAPVSPSDWRNTRNLARDLRRAGLDISWRDIA